jgi:hypothetical protein
MESICSQVYVVASFGSDGMDRCRVISSAGTKTDNFSQTRAAVTPLKFMKIWTDVLHGSDRSRVSPTHRRLAAPQNCRSAVSDESKL